MPAPIPPPAHPPPLRLEHPLPPYRYVPGLNPHPLKHPQGHSLDPERIPLAHQWIRGLDLFDHRYYWEAHEVWEAVWKAVPEGSERQLLQGLIQLSAATLKHHLGQPRPCQLLLQRGGGRVEAVIAAEGSVWRGLDLPATLARVHAFVGGGDWPAIVSAAPLSPRS